MNEELLLELKEDNRRMAEEFAQESLADAIVRFYYTDENEDDANLF